MIDLQALGRRVPRRLRPLLREVLESWLWVCGRIVRFSPSNRIKAKVLKRRRPLKLNVGSGKAKLPGWINIDIEPGADLVWDVRKGLPFADNSVDLIYNEHFLEHLTYEEGTKVIGDFFRCLKPGGTLRIAMPDLDYVVERYSPTGRIRTGCLCRAMSS